jgi:membrane protein DedA with SNARE-associated domain
MWANRIRHGEMMEHAFQWITTYGYVAIFGLLILGIVGLPVPDEALLTFVGYLSFKGELHLGGAVLAAILGTSCGITISYG